MNSETEVGRYVRAPRKEVDVLPDVGAEVEIEGEFDEQRDDEANEANGKLEQFRRTDSSRSPLESYADREDEAVDATTNSWIRSKLTRRSEPVNVRWELLKPFPKGVPSSKL